MTTLTTTVSTNRLYLNGYARLVHSLISSTGGCIYGPIVTSWVLPCIWPTLDEPFSMDTIDDNEEDMYNKLHGLPIDFAGAPQQAIIAMFVRKDYKFSIITPSYEDPLHMLYDVTETITSTVRFKYRIRAAITIPFQVDFDVSRIIYSINGVSTVTGFSLNLIRDAVFSTCKSEMVVPAGIDDEAVDERLRVAKKILDRINDGWRISNVPIITTSIERESETYTCLICQDLVDEKNYVILHCQCQNPFHLSCVRQLVLTELETKTFFKCPGCRDELFIGLNKPVGSDYYMPRQRL